MAKATTRAAVLLVLSGCSSAHTAPPRAAVEAPAHATVTDAAAPARPSPDDASVDADAPADAAPEAPADAASASADSTEIVVTAGSDLPPEGPSSTGPFAQAVDLALAPHAAALTECMRPVIPRQRRLYRVMIGADGRITERPPQAIALSLRVQDCLHTLLRAVTISPAPPRPVPYDIAVQPAQDRVFPGRR